MGLFFVNCARCVNTRSAAFRNVITRCSRVGTNASGSAMSMAATAALAVGRDSFGRRGTQCLNTIAGKIHVKEQQEGSVGGVRDGNYVDKRNRWWMPDAETGVWVPQQDDSHNTQPDVAQLRDELLNSLICPYHPKDSTDN